MKVIKGIFDFIRFIFDMIWFILRPILILVLILIILLECISVFKKIKYTMYKETHITINGNLCISHMCEGGGGNEEKYYNSDRNVLQKAKGFYLINGIKLGIGNTTGDVFGRVYKPINSGTSDIYVGYSTFGGDPIRYFELYHVEVDKDMNITYNMEIIDEKQFEEDTMNLTEEE